MSPTRAVVGSDLATAHLNDAMQRSSADTIAAATALATFKDDPAIAAIIRDAASKHRDSKTNTAILALLE